MNPDIDHLPPLPALKCTGELSPAIIVDTREPDPHPWAPHLPGVELERATLDTGDLCLAVNPLVAIERKTPSDMLGCMTTDRERFERELRRAGATLDRFCIVVEGALEDLLLARRGMHVNAVVGTGGLDPALSSPDCIRRHSKLGGELHSAILDATDSGGGIVLGSAQAAYGAEACFGEKFSLISRAARAA